MNQNELDVVTQSVEEILVFNCCDLSLTMDVLADVEEMREKSWNVWCNYPYEVILHHFDIAMRSLSYFNYFVILLSFQKLAYCNERVFFFAFIL